MVLGDFTGTSIVRDTIKVERSLMPVSTARAPASSALRLGQTQCEWPMPTCLLTKLT